jgi:hypothetical protein
LSRTLSNTATAAVHAAETGEAFLVLLEIGAVKLVNNYADITHNGDTYTAYPFAIVLPDDSDDNTPTSQIEIDNVGQAVIALLREATTPPAVVIKVVLADSPDTVEAGPFNMTLREANYTAHTVTCTLAYEDVFNEPYPGDAFTPANFPGLY